LSLSSINKPHIFYLPTFETHGYISNIAGKSDW
jgi:hypothetical protein